MSPQLSRRQALASVGAAAAWFAAPHASAQPAPSRNVMLFGAADAPPGTMSFRAGPVTCVFEPGIAFLRYIKYGDKEILRGLYAAVRDKVWGTVAPRVTNVTAETRTGSFRLTFDVECKEAGIDFFWQGVITGDASGTVRFEMNGRARSTFLKNRLGFAVLHPIKECAGQACEVEHPGGMIEKGTFPGDISPNQPFKDMRAITHTIEPGILGEVRFEGDLFEMEDHRNWTDGNYKTYCTPLDLPFPVEVPRGKEVRQAVTIRVKGATAAPASASTPEVTIEPAKSAATKLPAIGFGIATDAPELTAQEIARLAALKPAHLRVDLHLASADWAAALDRAIHQARALKTGLEAAVFVTAEAEAELARLAAAVTEKKPPIIRWLIFHRDETSTNEKWIRAARARLTGTVGSGTNHYFTELNRERPALDAIDLACYSINPQVHAFDNQSLVENLEAQADTVRSAHKFLGSKPVVVSRVTLRPRFNPQAKGAPEPVVEGRLPSRIDSRQLSLFGAAWTLGSIKYLAESNVAAITCYETHGWAGLMETAKGSAAPTLFPSTPGAVFPLYHVLAAVGEFAGGTVQPLSSSAPLRACALALESGRRKRMLVANLTPEPGIVRVATAALGRRLRISRLDEASFEEATRRPEAFRKSAGELVEPSGTSFALALAPYAVAQIDALA